MKNHLFSILLFCLALPLLVGCSNYVTPGGGVSIMEIPDEDIKELFEREPSSSFPARLAVARIQDKGYASKTNEGYASKTNEGYGSGRYSIYYYP